jgi:hypothetical protein
MFLSIATIIRKKTGQLCGKHFVQTQLPLTLLHVAMKQTKSQLIKSTLNMSLCRFGLSQVGYGWDFYQTYEMLYLCVIPIAVEERDSCSHELFEGLPVLFVPKLGVGTTRQDVTDAIHNYTASETFQNASFVCGWEHLFFHY